MVRRKKPILRFLCRHDWETVSVHGPIQGKALQVHSVQIYMRCKICDKFKRKYP